MLLIILTHSIYFYYLRGPEEDYTDCNTKENGQSPSLDPQIG